MSLPVKLGLIGVMGAGATATYFGVFHFAMPDWDPLAKDSDASTTYSSSKYAEHYQQFLVGVGTISSSPTNTQLNNDDWWDWSFKYRYNGEDAKGGFANTLVTGGAKGSSDTNKSLKEACKKAYQATSSNVVSDTSTDVSGDDKFKEDDIWKFCTAVGTKPKTVEKAAEADGEDKTESGTSGKWNNNLGATKKGDLLAIYDRANDFAWAVLDEQFSKDKIVNGFFSKSPEKGSSIRWRCESAYSQSETGESDDTKPKEADLYKWCSLKGRKTT